MIYIDSYKPNNYKLNSAIIHKIGHFLINKDGTYPPDIKGTEMEERLADRVGLNIMQMRGVPVPYIMHRNGMYKNIFTLDEDLVDYSYEVMKHLR